MIVDIRYHIASLVAVFLALGLGILIGATLLDDGKLLESQEKLIAGLERQFDRLQVEKLSLEGKIAQLNHELQQRETVLNLVEAPLIRGVLQGQVVAVFYGGRQWQEQLEDSVRELLQEAGAQVEVSEVLTMQRDNMDIPAGEFNIEEKKQKKTWSWQDGVDVVLLVGGGGEEVLNRQIQLVKELAGKGIPVAAVESGEGQFSLADLAQYGAVVMDSIDSSQGRIGLIRGLLYGQPGYYGTGANAQDLLPALMSLPAEGGK